MIRGGFRCISYWRFVGLLNILGGGLLAVSAVCYQRFARICYFRAKGQNSTFGGL